MQSWLVDFRRGKRLLRHRQPLRSLHYLERALESFPTDRPRRGSSESLRRRELALVFYYLGIALRKAGMRNRAVGSWVEAVRLIKRGPIRRHLFDMTNEYGMARQASADLDDRQAFYGIQLARYVRSKRSHKLGTRAEIDVVADLIDDAWTEVESSEATAGKSVAEKLRVFTDTIVVFPFLSVPDALHVEDGAVDFLHGHKVGPADRCVCGSGLPYRMCHGRTPGTDEALIGKF